ncbi:MAG: lysozyme inhibitor LprI family protein [Pseudomonadota bacterium]
MTEIALVSTMFLRCYITRTRTIGKAVALAVWLIAPPALAYPLVVAPSYDCTSAGLTKIEQTICTTPWLADRDVHLSRQYRFVRELPGETDAVHASQRAWLHARNEDCGGLADNAMTDCLTTHYDDRLKALAELAEAAPPSVNGWTGAWANMVSDITIKAADGQASFEGNSVYITLNVCEYGPNLGNFEATMPVGALGERSFTAGSDDCRLQLTLEGALLQVEQLEPFACAGHNVSFAGVYSQGGMTTDLDCN